MQNRKDAKNKLSSASNEMGKAAEKVADVGAIFQDRHPEIETQLANIYKAALSIQQAINKLDEDI